MDELISRQEAIDLADAMWEATHDKNIHELWSKLIDLPPAQPDVPDKNVGDIISRQDAIDVTWEEMPYSEPWYVLTEVRKRLKAVPSAHPDYDLSGYSDRLWKAAYERGKAEAEPRWIPVTEQTLPRENSTVVAIGKTATWDVGNYRGHAESNIHRWYWKKNTMKDVYWWMYKKDALPKPYERSKDE